MLERIANLFLRRSLAIYLAIVVAQSLYMVAVDSDNPRYAGIAGTDGQAYYAFVRSLAIDGDLDFENEFYEHNYNRHGFQTRDFLPRSPHTGLYFNRYGVGYSILIAPFFLLAHVLTPVGRLGGLWSWAADGYTPLYQFVPPLAAFVFGGMAFWTTRRILSRFVGDSAASAATFVTFLCSPLSHGTIAFWCSPTLPTLVVYNLLLLAAFRVEDGCATAWHWVALGALAGLGGALRTENVLFVLVPILLVLFGGSKEGAGGCSPRRIAIVYIFVGVGFILAFFPQILAWRAMWGTWFHVAMNNPGERFNWTSPALWQVLFSTRHGLFYWSPLLFVGFCGWVWFLARRTRSATLRIATVHAVVMYYVYASWSVWWMGYSFGARQFIPFTALFALGLGAIYDALPRRRVWLVSAAILSAMFVFWNQAMLYMFVNGHIPRSEGFPVLAPVTEFLELAGRVF
ncbi:hypothetical protein JW916_02140 [Candidatus Sumerlaeota bacterium]|nr:hypothetical protein [Candidatus Sumerlaeota bacterium]